MYNAPTRPQREISADYPNGAPHDATGRLTHAFEGRPLFDGGRIAGRRYVEGADEAIPPTEFDAIAKDGTGEVAKIVAPSQIGGDAGRVVTNRDRRSGDILDSVVYLSDDLTDAQFTKVYAHELGTNWQLLPSTPRPALSVRL